MLTWIVAHSDALCNFLTPLLIGFSPAQLRHALNCIEALLVCTSKHKTLSALTRLLRLPHADEFALADFFSRQSLGERADPESRDLVSLARRLHDSTADGMAFALSADRRRLVSEGCCDRHTRSRYFPLRSFPVASAKREIHQQFALCHPWSATRSGAIRLGMAALFAAQTDQATQSDAHPRNTTDLCQTAHARRTDAGRNCPAFAPGLSGLCAVRCVVRQTLFAKENSRARLSLDVCNAFQSQCV